MKSNILPFAIIAIVGLFAAIIVFYVGVAQRDDMRLAEEGGGENETEEVETDPETIYANNCASCHGGDLAGVGNFPALDTVGAKMSQDEIKDIIVNGTDGGMPAGLVTNEEELDILSGWLAEKK